MTADFSHLPLPHAIDAAFDLIRKEIGLEPKTDRDKGLPRSNYTGDWGRTIQNMSQKARDAILDKLPRTKSRG